MEKNLHSIFQAEAPRPSESLSNAIWDHIVKIDNRRRHLQMWIYGILGGLSFATLIPVASDLSSQFSKSGFYEYVSLAFSDTASLGVYWKELMLSIVDALPATSLILSLSLLFILLLSIKRVTSRLRTSAVFA